MEELEVLTKKFRDYIDKVQVTLDKAEKVIPKLGSSDVDSSDKFYTVVSPADVMTNNLKSVLNALDKAIVNIDEMSNAPSEDALIFADAVASSGEENSSESQVANRIFSSDELEFLEKTFNKILNASDKERDRIFEDLDKIGNS